MTRRGTLLGATGSVAASAVGVENTLTAAGSKGLLVEPPSIEEALALDLAARRLAEVDLVLSAAA